MRQFLLGTVFGAATAAIALSLFGRGSAESTPLPQVSTASPNAGLASQPLLTASSPLAQERQPGAAARQSAPSPVTSVETAMDTRIPIRLSTDHANMLAPAKPDGRPPTLSEQHMQLLTERKDSSWALEMEENLSQFLAQNNATGEFELLSVECRTTLCEILAFGNLPASPQHWNLLGAELSKQPWWSNFQGNSTASSAQNGRTTIVTILQRKSR
jgi:hypothetical protein